MPLAWLITKPATFPAWTILTFVFTNCEKEMLNIKYLSNLKHNLKHAGIAQKITKVNELFHNIQIFLSLKLLPLVKTKILILTVKIRLGMNMGSRRINGCIKVFICAVCFFKKKSLFVPESCTVQLSDWSICLWNIALFHCCVALSWNIFFWELWIQLLRTRLWFKTSNKQRKFCKVRFSYLEV